MSVFVDTGLFYALQNQRSSRHQESARALAAVFDGTFGHVFTSDYVYDETVTLVRARTGRFTEAWTVGCRMLGDDGFPSVVEMVYVSETVFEHAIETFERYRDHSLSFTDATTIALVDHHDIDAVLSFDDDFDGIVNRLDPADVDER